MSFINNSSYLRQLVYEASLAFQFADYYGTMPSAEYREYYLYALQKSVVFRSDGSTNAVNEKSAASKDIYPALAEMSRMYKDEETLIKDFFTPVNQGGQGHEDVFCIGR